MDDTIVALATALGEAGIHIIRLSGPQSKEILDRCFEPHNSVRWLNNESHTLHLGWFRQGDQRIDQVLVGRMHAPHSYTGEDVFEINCHGGAWVAQSIIQSCIREGARLAEPGEFTKRAFLNGKLDLVQAEAVIDLISARTRAAADQALTQLSGRLSEEILALRDNILEILAFIEASIDFPEDDVESLDWTALKGRLEDALRLAGELLLGSKSGRIVREGLTTVIVGRPNVGKSSLLNALLQEERAIVTDVPGTTRDEIREFVSLGGILLQLIDTAGIRESADPVEQMGIRRSWEALDRADLILLVVDAGVPLNVDEREVLRQYGERVLVLLNKIDLHPQSAVRSTEVPGVCIPFSVVRHEGFDALEAEIRRLVFNEHLDSARPLLSNVRQIAALEGSAESLKNALLALEAGYPWDILSIDVRRALQEVSEITGHNVQKSLLEVIFSRFCIGK
ncbi:MAG: tRNA uridine-5-carboxymethylaminomethyl(34) synthesis GTPase MnmE [Desulfitobacteriaceae bacterium]|nr:tRNA uridine-5-carboxymethylaminomethyl(34) synthesis GTPase MnmE [Desulfitobacteriaceae bacterium]MDI6914412.1 tRNA uridine-5-carboxymethylaminomethyl(34) synthesis GTPase MnmE [Desulfitobacteriaceae bacterium]